MAQIVDRPEQLQHDLLHRSFTMRIEAGQAPRWASGWPVAVHGWLPGGQPWAILFGRDIDGPAVDLSVSSTRCNVAIHRARLRGSRNENPGELNQDHGGEVRTLCWLTGSDVDRVELDTDSGSIPVPRVHVDDGLGVRVHFTVIDDETLVLREARHLDAGGGTLTGEDLTWAQQRFAADRAQERRWAAQALAQHAAGSSTGAVFRIFGSPTAFGPPDAESTGKLPEPPPDRT